MKKKPSLITLEEALSTSGHASLAAYARHVNSEEATLLKMLAMDRHYVRAEGIHLYDEAGRAYLDFTAGYGSLNLGHNPPEVLAAVDKARVQPSVLLAGYNHLAGLMAQNLATLLPGDLDVVAFGNGGAEAVELALKTARACTGRQRFVSCEDGYHGLTFGALSVSGSPRYRRVFGPLVEHCETIPFNDLGALEQRLQADDVAAFIVEPIQAEGGMVVPADGYLASAAEICHRHGTLLVLDEIQTGMGRTGRLFALEHDDVVPDLVLLSKSLGAGVVPISVCVTTEPIWNKAFGARDRFDLVISTFGGNAAACAAAIKTLEITLRDRLPEQAAEQGDHARTLLNRLAEKHDIVAAVRGRGLLLGIELAPPDVPGAHLEENLSPLIASVLLNDHGILTSYCDLDPSVLRFEPPITVTRAQIEQAVNAFDAALGLGVSALLVRLGKTLLGRTFV